MMMNKKMIELNKRSLVADFSWLPSLEKIIQKKTKIKKTISIALISDSEIKEYNRVYRNKNKITDVLSFVLDGDDNLGEIVISLEQAKRQAKQNNRTIKSELQWLTVHGILHLLGYDHEIDETEAVRQRKEEQKILKLLS